MFQRLIDRVDGTLPGQCAVCRAWPARPLCDGCVSRFAQPHPRCRTCALPMTVDGDRCGACLVERPPLDACHAAVTYDYPWSALITQFKFHGQASWARAFATLMRSAPWVEPALERADHVLAMPLARERLAERGFNQALELAKHLAPGRVDATLLLRVRNTSAQSALGRKERIANVKGAFAVDPLRADELRGRHVVLVDDVMTSGASLHAAARVLHQAGAAQVTALVLARTDEPGG